MDTLPVMTTEIALVLGIVVITVILFATEVLRVDVTALLVMTLLGLLIRKYLVTGLTMGAVKE